MMNSTLLPIRSLLTLSLAWLIAGGVVSAQSKEATRKGTVPVTSVAPERPRQVAQTTDAAAKMSKQQREEREKVAIAFAKEHHPALERLLNSLRDMDKKEYTKAVRELARVSDRLNSLKQRNPRVYQLQLDIWKANSSATLLSARVELNPYNEKLYEELRAALEKKRTLQRRLLQEELERATQRVERLEQNLKRFDEESEAAIERQLRRLSLLEDQSSKPEAPSK